MSSDQLTLVDRESLRSSSPETRCHARDRESILDTVSYFAMGFVLVGVVFSAVGFLYPRTLNHDPQASASENEQQDHEYMQLNDALNAVILAGMILTGLGGLIISAIFTNSVLCRECHNDDENRTVTSPQLTTSQQSSPGVSAARTTNMDGKTSTTTDYGTVSHESTPAVER